MLRLFGNKRDKSEAPIVEHMRKRGMSVYLMDKPCDLLIGYRGKNYLGEVKTPRKQGGMDTMTEDQISFNDTWRGMVPYVFRTIADVDTFRLAVSVQDTLNAEKIAKSRRSLTGGSHA